MNKVYIKIKIFPLVIHVKNGFRNPHTKAIFTHEKMAGAFS
jgi:hypothetical protein